VKSSKKTIKMNTTVEISHLKLESFVGQVIGDLSATMGSVMTQIGHKLGFFVAMHGAGPMSPRTLAAKTGTHERYVQEWLNCQTAGGYITYDPKTKTYTLPIEHGMVLADPDSPAYLAAGLDIPATIWSEEERLVSEFRSGKGFAWHEHAHKLFFGVEAFYRNGYKNFLTTNWIPALEGVKEKLELGGLVADVGCGHGASTLVMAKAFPKSRFCGFDYHEDSIVVARQRAKEQGITNAFFEVASAESYPASGYDLICFMDAFHDLGKPGKAAAYAKKCLAPTGSLMLVEPLAGDNVEDNINPIGRMYYAGSTALCVPHSQADGGDCFGAQAGGAKLHKTLLDAGFSIARTATTSAVNMIVEAKI
jgi:SAM-dependent methyltransferase